MWDHVPAAHELLEARLARGWKPTPSPLKAGDRVLGYAACAVTHVPHRPSVPHLRRDAVP